MPKPKEEATPKTPRVEPREKAQKLVAFAVGLHQKKANSTEARNSAMKACLFIAEHDLLTVPVSRLDPAAVAASAAVATSKVRDMAAEVRAVANDPGVQGMAATLVDLFKSGKAVADAAAKVRRR